MCQPTGKVPLEKRLVRGHVLQRHYAPVGHDLHHAVDQQERIAVRQDALDGNNIQLSLVLRRGRRFGFFELLRQYLPPRHFGVEVRII